MKKIYLLLITTLLVFIISGCNFVGTTKFTTEEEAKTYVLQSLQEKYGIDFVIANSEYELYESGGIVFHKLLTGQVQTADGQYTDIYFRALSKEGLDDNFSKIYYEQPITDMVEEFMKNNPIENMVSYEIKRVGCPRTRRKWDGTESLEEYIATEKPEIEIAAYFGEGYNYEEYGKQFVNYMQVMTQLDIRKSLTVGIIGNQAQTMEYFWYEWETPNENRLESMEAHGRGEIHNLAKSGIENPLTDIPWIREIILSLEGEKDFYWGVGETTDSYIQRNNLSVQYWVWLDMGWSAEEYAEKTMEILEILETAPHPKILKIELDEEGRSSLEMGIFEFTDTYTEKTEEEILEEYRVILEQDRINNEVE